MDPCFSFSKRPITLHKRHSTISSILPHSNSTGDENDKSYTHSKQTLNSGSKSCSNDNLCEDNPLLDHNEQIRAPKFLSKRSLDDIGSVIKDFKAKDLVNANDNDDNDDNDTLRQTPGAKEHKLHSNDDDENNELTHVKSVYQPAIVDITKTTSFDCESPGAKNSGQIYNIEQFMNKTSDNTHFISNLNVDTSSSASLSTTTTDTTNTNNTTTTTTPNKSPLSSKKSSHESITFLTSKKQPRFTLVPIRPIDEPKTPNYVPCVLRTSYTHPNLTQTNDDNDLNTHLLIDGYNSTLPVSSTDDSNLLKTHWKPNNAYPLCFDCQKPFSLMNRRHHCRKCGEIFCSSCLLSQAKLNLQCQFDLDGIITKVCFPCGKDYSSYLIEKFQQGDDGLYPNFKKKLSNKADNEDLNTSVIQDLQQKNGHVEEAGSGGNVPADWTWSSF